MANDSKTQAKRSGLQSIVAFLDFFLKPLVDPDEKQTRDEILAYLGLKADFFNTPHATDAVQAFLEKKPEDAGFIDFGKAIKQQTDIIRKIDDAVKQSGTHFTNDEMSKERVVNDTTTMLLNILVLEHCRERFPAFHNWMMVLYSLNNFSNRGGGVVPIFDLIGKYLKRWKDAYDNGFATREDARVFTEGFYLIFVGVTFGLNDVISKRASKNDIDRTMLLGGQAGNEANLIKTPTKAREFADHLLNRSATLSFNFMNGGKETASTLTLITLSEEDGGKGIEVFSNNDFDFPVIKLSDNWFLSIKGKGKLNFRVGADAKSSDNTDVSQSKISIAAERLVFPKGAKAEDIDIPNLFDFFQFGFGNSSLQIEASKGDVVLRFVTQITYAVQKTKVVDGKEKKAGFPFKFIPETSNIVDVPIRYSFKNGFGFDGGFVGERPKDNAARSLTNAPSVPTLGTYHIPIHRDIGIIRFDKLHLGFDTADGLAVQATLDFTLKFGKVVVISIAELGASLVATKRTEKPVNGGFFGYDLNPKFLPPKGAGIAIDAKVIKGGGFLYFNEPKGEYYGAVELALSGLSFFPNVSLNAIGIVRTKDDAGKEQFSLLFLITAEFPPIQIGFGFTWEGVGGLLALNRRANVQFIQEGLSSGVLQSILFPKDVVANMSRIISNLNSAFPVQDNRFAIGLMVKLGWGTPSKIKLLLGLIVEFPELRILVPGILKARFPSEDKAILSIDASFIGIYDHKNQFVYFRAELSASRLLVYKLSGSIAFGISWGNPSVLVISAGGFHPRFTEIPSLPTLPNAFGGMKRLTIQILDTDNPRIICESYFAITSNTVQFGSKTEIYYDIFSGKGGYNIYGRLEYNALFHFNPFHFIFEIDAEIALRDGDDWVMGIGIYGILEGPTPWHVRIRGTVEIDWFPDIDFTLEKTWGSKKAELPPAIAKVSADLNAAFKDPRNWAAEMPQATLVSFRKMDDAAATRGLNDAEKVCLHPNGGLSFSQNIAPLGVTLEKFGEQRPDINRFVVNSVKIGTAPPIVPPSKKDLFAADMFINLTDDERLSRPSFEQMPSGFDLAAMTDLKVGSSHIIDVVGEISEGNRPKTEGKPKVGLKDRFGHFVRSSSATYKSEPSNQNRMRRGGYQHLAPKTEGKFAVADKADASNIFGKIRFDSFTEAKQALDKQKLRRKKEVEVVDNQGFIVV